MKPSLALSWFEQIQRLTSDSARAVFLQQVINAGTSESDYLEFKGCLQNGSLLPDEKLRELYGKALSAFANTGGGVMVWGISAPADHAESPALAPDAAVLCSKLDVIERDVTNPPVLGVQKFPVIAEGTKGFVVCFVPESRWKPHARRMNGKDEYYYMRVSSHSVQADHSTLRRLFFPEYYPYLEVSFLTIFNPCGFQQQKTLQVDVSVHNRGPGTADEVTAYFLKMPGHQLSVSSTWGQIPAGSGGSYLRSAQPMHVDEKRHLISIEIPVPNFSSDDPAILARILPFLVRITARNTPPVMFEYVLNVDHVNGAQIIPTPREVET